MSKIDDLINKLCPNGVKYFELGEIATFSQGIQVAVNEQKYEKQDGFIRFLRIIDYTDNNEPPRYIKKPDDKYIKKENELIMIRYGTPGKVCIDYEGAIANNMFKINFNIDEINTKYMYYYLSQNSIYNKLSTSVKSTMPSINFGIVSKIIVAVPPLEVQCEIVHILDDFTLLSAELSAELKARQQQYDYYKTKLFEFSNDAEYLPLEKIAEIGTGSSNTNEAVDDGKYPFFVRSQQLYRKNTFEYDETAIITSGDGVGVGKIFHYIEGKYALHQRAYRIHITNEKVIPKYFFYYMKTTFYDYIMKNAFNSSVTSVRRPMLNKYPVPIPSKEEQERIVNILDRFDKLCNDITDGLPAEIEARQKQYEYYRDKLLTFKELKVSEVQ